MNTSRWQKHTTAWCTQWGVFLKGILTVLFILCHHTRQSVCKTKMPFPPFAICHSGVNDVITKFGIWPVTLRKWCILLHYITCMNSGVSWVICILHATRVESALLACTKLLMIDVTTCTKKILHKLSYGLLSQCGINCAMGSGVNLVATSIPNLCPALHWSCR